MARQPAVPLDAGRLEAAKALVASMPALAGLVVVLSTIVASSRPVRTQALAGYRGALAAGCAFEATRAERLQSAHRAATWILVVSTLLAFASEVAP